MKLLLDTHTILWMVNEHDKLSPTAKSYLLNHEHDLYVSIASIWEIAIKASIGKLTNLAGGVGRFVTQIEKMPVELLSITPRYVEIVESLPFIHRDPFDRVLIATAQAEGMSMVTADENIPKYSVLTIW